jgi:hypothetical protein
MYVCMNGCMCVYIHTCMHTYPGNLGPDQSPHTLYVRMYAFKNVSMHVCMYVCIYVCIYIDAYIYGKFRTISIAKHRVCPRNKNHQTKKVHIYIYILIYLFCKPLRDAPTRVTGRPIWVSMNFDFSFYFINFVNRQGMRPQGSQDGQYGYQ